MKAASHVVVIGCGESGILAGIRLSQAGLPFTIIDKNDGPGGTWWENRYPGARVDVGSHQYCYSFEPGDHWSEYYSQQPELRDYFADVVEKYELQPHCRFGTTVTAITWDESSARWRVDVRGRDGATEVIDAQFVVSAVGSLNLPHLPDIPGMDTFAGRSFHSARWPDDLDISGTRFALVGAGASGFQIAPSIADRSRAALDLSAHRAVDVPESAVPHDRARRRPVGAAAPAVLRALVPVHDDLPGHLGRHHAVQARSRLPRRRRPGDQRGQRGAP